jgi:hypothetical protein
MNICIVGAGWYGCHIAKNLIAVGYKTTIYEKDEILFNGASGSNQNRLHLGFHYPRNHRTRIQSLIGYDRFIEEYPDVVSKIKNNIYSVPLLDSLIDFKTYQGIMASTGIPFSTCQTPSFLDNIEGSILTNEMLINVSKARKYFMKKLHGSINFCSEVKTINEKAQNVIVNGESFDYVIDTTWGHLIQDNNCFYELSLLLLMKKKRQFDYAITLVDGDLWSIYPTEDSDIFTLSSVIHTPLFTEDSKELFEKRKLEISDDLLFQKRRQITEHVQKTFPSLYDFFDFFDYQISVKTKLKTLSSDRSCYVKRTNRIISIFSGKIDNIFYASDNVMKILISEN